jgi:hypothetical protein
MGTKKQPKPPAVFLVSIRITGNSAADCRRFAKRIADKIEEDYTLEVPAHPVIYDLNLSQWEPVK